MRIRCRDNRSGFSIVHGEVITDTTYREVILAIAEVPCQNNSRLLLSRHAFIANRGSMNNRRQSNERYKCLFHIDMYVFMVIVLNTVGTGVPTLTRVEMMRYLHTLLAAVYRISYAIYTEQSRSSMRISLMVNRVDAITQRKLMCRIEKNVVVFHMGLEL